MATAHPSQFNLFADLSLANCATTCEAYGVCGGARSTAPCGCAWKIESGLRYQCHHCYLICRERRQRGPLVNGPGLLTFAEHIAAGYALEQVSISQHTIPPIPLFIPTHTHDFKNGLLNLRWVGADVRSLFNSRRHEPAVLNPYFNTETGTRHHLKVGNDCQLLAVLNGQDWMLESFWGMARQQTLRQLSTSGFSAGTGATFSVTSLTTQNTLVPFAHHSAMLMRHHRTLVEMQTAGLCSIPNLYWLDGDQREIERWASWLQDNPLIHSVSRDFSSTNHWSVVSKKLKELLLLLNMARRSFHVLIVGTGQMNAPRIAKALAEAGHTVSIVTSAPIMKALSGVKYDLSASGKIIDCATKRSDYSFSDLIQSNMAVFEEALFKAIQGSSYASSALYNAL
jgi:hypothetical protein